eukprot:5676878-Prymnesium_polylepis.1
MYGAFVHAVDLFDPDCFAVSRAEAGAMDPQQRVLLELGYGALHGGGRFKSDLLESDTGIFLGMHPADWGGVLPHTPAAKSVYAATGYSSSVASGRLSFVLGLQGPCFASDTACSAGLVATNCARSALLLDECNTAVAMATNFMLTETIHLAFAIASVTSPSGRCFTFDARADGYARAESCGAAMITVSKPDRARALQIRGVVVQCDGKSASLTAPNGRAQRKLLLATHAQSAVGRNELSCEQAHGTGTALGDPIEVRSLVSEVVLQRTTDASVTIASVKGNTGHAEPGAGFSGLLALAAQLLWRLAPPNAQLRVRNPNVANAMGGHVQCMLPVQCGVSHSSASTGGVNSFGYSGTIAHAILQSLPLLTVQEGPSQLLTYRHRTFQWRAGASISAPKTLWERTVASHAARRALDQALAARNRVKEQTEVAIVGAGLAGLLIAAKFTEAKFEVLVIEKSATAGGTWRQHGNAYSRVNSSEPSYRLIEKKANSNHSYHGEILSDALQLIKQHGLASRICTGSEVRRVISTRSGWLLEGQQKGGAFQLACDNTILCTNRRLGSPRQMHLRGEGVFSGA